MLRFSCFRGTMRWCSFFFFKGSAAPRDLPSSPPRRSPDPRRRHGRVARLEAAQLFGEVGAVRLLPEARLHQLDRLSGVAALEVHLGQRVAVAGAVRLDRKSTRLNSSHLVISYAVFCLKKKK